MLLTAAAGSMEEDEAWLFSQVLGGGKIINKLKVMPPE